MKERYSFKEIIASYTPEKKASDGPWTRWVLRPPSFIFAKLFFSLGLGANTVSCLSALLAMAGFFLLALGGGALPYLGFLCFFLFGVLDCADGNMARTVRFRRGNSAGGAFGEWIDAVSGYVAYAAFFLGAGALCGKSGGGPWPGGSLWDGTFLPPWFWQLSAGAALGGNLLARLAFQSYRASASSARSETGGERKFSESIGITGFLVPLSTAAFYFGLLWMALALYALIYCGGFFFIVIKIMRTMNGRDKE